MPFCKSLLAIFNHFCLYILYSILSHGHCVRKWIGEAASKHDLQGHSFTYQSKLNWRTAKWLPNRLLKTSRKVCWQLNELSAVFDVFLTTTTCLNVTESCAANIERYQKHCWQLETSLTSRKLSKICRRPWWQLFRLPHRTFLFWVHSWAKGTAVSQRKLPAQTEQPSKKTTRKD